MKTLKFKPELTELILNDQKTSTWRLFDDKDLQEGDEVILLNSESKKEFAKAVLYDVKERLFGELSDEDRDGHEDYANTEEMLAAFSVYYNQEVTLQTPVKIAKFKIIEKY